MILIPVIGALVIGHGFGDIRKYVESGIDQVFNVAIMFIFAIIYFGLLSQIVVYSDLLLEE